MDYNKIGNFIMNERKSKKLTQSKLAEKLFVSEKTISKWENGNGLPDTNSLPKLCEILDVSINELLNGERITSENYTNKAESTILELQKSKEISDKRLLNIEIVLGLISTLSFFILLFSSIYLIYNYNAVIAPIITTCLGFIIFIVGISFCIYIEQISGYYTCPICHHKYIPKYSQVCFSMHIGRTRHMKCPNCKKRSWNKKVIK